MRPIDADNIDFSKYNNALKAIANTPTLDVVPREEGDLGRAIEFLKNTYTFAQTQEWIKQPLVYALYRTWKQFDRRK